MAENIKGLIGADEYLKQHAEAARWLKLGMSIVLMQMGKHARQRWDDHHDDPQLGNLINVMSVTLIQDLADMGRIVGNDKFVTDVIEAELDGIEKASKEEVKGDQDDD